MLFSVIIPAYKRSYLSEAMQSVLAQTYSSLELIVVNDASPEDLDSVVAAFDDPRIHYYKNERNCGAVHVVDNWNICLSYAKGDYVVCMGDDDRLLPNCLEEYIKLIYKYPGIGLLHGMTEIINEESVPVALTGRRCEHESVVSLIWHRKFVYRSQYIGDFCFQRDWLVKQGGFFYLPLAWGSDDISAYIGASLNGVANTQQVVFQYRINAQTITSTGNTELKLEAAKLEYEWIQKFLSNPRESLEDELYRKQIIDELPRLYEKKKALTIAGDLKGKGLVRLFFWLQYKNRFQLNVRILFYAFAKSLH
jgi:glycosyltransferase involved in cell wall biosynthesis